MPRMGQIVVPLMALLAGVAIAGVLYRTGATNIVGAVLLAGFAGLLGAYCDTLLDRLTEKRRTQSALDHLQQHQQRLRADADLTRRALVELKLHVDDRIATRNDRVVTEVKVLESLVRRMADGIAGRARDHEPHDDEIKPRTARSLPSRIAEDAPDDAMLEMIRRSLEENRVDIYLQPVVSLPQRKVRFYEALSRLRTEDGTIIMPSQYIRIAEPAGLMSVVDNVLLFRCIQILRSWSQRNKDIAVFCNLSRDTLQDVGFFREFVEFMQQHRELASQLIFEISQETLTSCTPTESSNLAYLADLGFTFSMDKVTTLDIDFAEARARHIRYFKIPARLLLGDPAKVGARVHPADLKELLERFGLNLIAERVEHERDVVNLLDYNVDFGQGFLFGEPKPIREAIAEQGPHRTQAPPPPMPAKPRIVAGAARSA